MTRTHAFVAAAAVLSLVAALQPAARWVQRLQTPDQPPVSHGTSGPGTLQLEAALSHQHPLEGGSTYVRYDVRASEAKLEQLNQPVQLALVMDRSGSMAGEKLARARDAARALVDLLRDDDELAIVTFGSDVSSFPLTRTDASGKALLRDFIDRIQDSGGTNISQALTAAQALLTASERRAIRRVVLVSDGQPSEGFTREADLVQLAVRLHEDRMAVSALGVGSDFNGPLMQHLADHGGGFYAYLNDPARLSQVLQMELTQARGAVARNAVIKLTVSGGAQLVQVAGRQMIRFGDEVRVPLQDFAPGQGAQAFVELKVPAGTASVSIDAQLEYVEAATDTHRVSQTARLSARTTDDASVADLSKDAQVALECMRAVGSTQMVEAAAAFQRGDRASAFAFLDNARNIFGMSADALAGSEVDETEKRWKKTYDPQAVRHEGMMLEKKKMSSFGQNNAY